MKTLGLIGGGKMASALIKGLLSYGFNEKAIKVSDHDSENRKLIEDRFQLQTYASNVELVEQSDILILAVKPQVIPQVVIEIASKVQAQQPLVISIVTGVSLQFFQNHFGSKCPIVRCMPNTPVQIGEGMTALHANGQVTAEQQKMVDEIFKSVGHSIWLKQENDLNKVTALSGSGPAYFYLFMEALQEAAVASGLDKKVAKELVLQTAIGSARMAQASSVELEDLRQQVTSPNGTTASALDLFEKKNFKHIVDLAYQAALKRAEELTC